LGSASYEGQQSATVVEGVMLSKAELGEPPKLLVNVLA